MTNERKSDWAERMEQDIIEVKGVLKELVDRTNQVGEQGRAIERAFISMEKMDARYSTELRVMEARVSALEKLAPETKLVTNGVMKVVGLIIVTLVSTVLIMVIRQPLPATLPYIPAPVPPYVPAPSPGEMIRP